MRKMRTGVVLAAVIGIAAATRVPRGRFDRYTETGLVDGGRAPGHVAEGRR